MKFPGRRTLVAVLLVTCAASVDARDSLHAQFALPDDQIDFTEAKLTVDKLIDPTTDVVAVRKAIAQWESAVRSNIPAGANARQQFDALVRTLYQPGPWNDERPFLYDLDDPLGRNAVNKRLSTYLKTRKGNCVSMPILVVILAQRLGLPATLAIAPSHVLAKFGDEAQQAWINFEATVGRFASDGEMEQKLGVTGKAIVNQLYLRPLTPRESLGVIASTLMEHHAAAEDGDALMAVADLALDVNPRDPIALVWKANAYYLQIEQRFVRNYPKASDIPKERVPEYLRLSRENLAYFKKAESLGWTKQTPEQLESYLQSIASEKARRERDDPRVRRDEDH